MKAQTRLMLVSLVCFLSFSPVAQALDEVTLQLRWYNQFQFAGYYMAVEKGFYAQQGIKVNIVPGGPSRPNPVEAILSQTAHFAISDSSAIIHYIQGDPVIAIAAISQTSPLVLITLKSKNIQVAQDLPGHTAMSLTKPADAELLALLKQEGIPLSSIEIIPASFDINDLINGKVDVFNGYISNEPYTLKKRNIDFNLIKPKDYGINFYNDVLISHKDIAEKNPELIKRFKQASLSGWQYAFDHIEESVDIIHKKYAPNKTRNHLIYESSVIHESILPNLVQIGHMNPGRWKYIISIYQDLGVISSSKNINDFIFNYKEPENYTFTMLIIMVFLIVLSIFSFAVYHFRKLSLALKLSNQELASLAISDPLTGIMNRRGFTENAERLISLEERQKKKVCLMILDIDFFKKINDQFGHHIGDFCLIEFTEIIQSCCRLHDLVARIGGEEFIILLGDCDTNQAREKASYIIKRVREHDFKPNGISNGINITVSIGLAEVKSSLSQAWQQADEALYTVKNSGRDGLQIYMPAT